MKNTRLFRKITGSIMTGVLLASMSCIPVMAANNEYTDAGTQIVPIMATIPSTYSVSIPASITLTDDDGDGVYSKDCQIGAKGSITRYEGVYVIPQGLDSLVVTGGGTSIPVTFDPNKKARFWKNNLHTPIGDDYKVLNIAKTDYVMDEFTVSVNLGDNVGTFQGSVTYRFGKTLYAGADYETTHDLSVTSYTGAELLNMIRSNQEKNKLDLIYRNADDVEIHTLNTLGASPVTRDASERAAILATAENPSSPAYIDPSDTYVLMVKSIYSDQGISVDDMDALMSSVTFVEKDWAISEGYVTAP